MFWSVRSLPLSRFGTTVSYYFYPFSLKRKFDNYSQNLSSNRRVMRYLFCYWLRLHVSRGFLTCKMPQQKGLSSPSWNFPGCIVSLTAQDLLYRVKNFGWIIFFHGKILFSLLFALSNLRIKLSLTLRDKFRSLKLGQYLGYLRLYTHILNNECQKYSWQLA